MKSSELALFFYSLYKERREADRLHVIEEERKRDMVTINWKSMNASMPRSIGAEHVCLDMLRRLGIDRQLSPRELCTL